jgi:hypothetical protein
MIDDQELEVIHVTSNDLDGAACAVLSKFVSPDRKVISTSDFKGIKVLRQTCFEKQATPREDKILIVTGIIPTPARLHDCHVAFGSESFAFFANEIRRPVERNVHYKKKQSVVSIFFDFLDEAVSIKHTPEDAFMKVIIEEIEKHYKRDRLVDLFSEKIDFFVTPVDDFLMGATEKENNWSLDDGEHLNRLFSFLGFDDFVHDVLCEYYHSLEYRSLLGRRDLREILKQKEKEGKL